MIAFVQIILLLTNLLKFAVFGHVILSLLAQFGVLDLRNNFVAPIWRVLNQILEPIYRPIRNILPPMSGIDFSPMVLIIGIVILQSLLISLV